VNPLARGSSRAIRFPTLSNDGKRVERHNGGARTSAVGDHVTARVRA